MERSEPTLVPEWLRSTGGGPGGGSSSHHFASSQADGPVSALPRRSRSSKSISNTDSLHSPLLDRSSSSNSRRNSSTNGFSKHEKNSYSRSYSSFSRNQRDRDRERSTIAENWDSEYSDPLRGMISGTEDPLRRTQSMISRRQGEISQRQNPADLRNGSYKNLNNGNGIHFIGSGVTGIQKGLSERDFPALGFEERPKTPDLVRVSSPGLSRAIQSLSIGNSPLVGTEGWTSALADVPTGAVSNSAVGSSSALLPASADSTSSSLSPVAASTSSGLNMAEALVQAPALSHNAPQPSIQSQRDELALAQSKKLIPMTPVLPKAMVLSSSDKLKPKTAMRSSETAVTPKNGMHHLSPLQFGSQPVRGASVRDGPKSPSSGKLLLLKPGRENGVSPGLKDLQSPTAHTNIKVTNGSLAGSPSVASGPSKSLHNPKVSPVERKTSAFGFNPGSVVDKRTSRMNFFNSMREKSINNTSPTVESGASGSSDVVTSADKETTELPRTQVTAETGTETKLNGETCTVADIFSHFCPDEKERAFLLSMGWEPRDDNAGGDEGLTEEEIRAFTDHLKKLGPPTTPRLARVLEDLFTHLGCSHASSQDHSAPASRTEV